MVHTKVDKASNFIKMITALGVVYGDIGTSPLYALRECFYGTFGIPDTPENVLGVLSLVFWSITCTITIKYILFITKADNEGEGGTFALLALLKENLIRHKENVFFKIVPFLGISSAALLYSDGIITPAISVLSAVEGINEVFPTENWVTVVATCVILIALFTAQKKGTDRIGKVFGPIMLIWFLSIALIGCIHIAHNPSILKAINPWYAASYMQVHRFSGIFILSAVVLCITGGEALYADLGHFGRIPIRNGWFFFVYPSLLLNYFGQGAFILSFSGTITHPFYQAIATPLQLPMVILATIATVIASQALISGVFSLTQQAINLGYLPRMHVIHTSSASRGQIYLPVVNGMLMLACVGLVIAFKASGGLAAAYGLAVTGAMFITSVLYFLVLRYVWEWSFAKSLPLLLLFLFFDLPFLAANTSKIPDSGWLPLVVAACIVLVMLTWEKGRQRLARLFEKNNVPISELKQFIKTSHLKRANRVGVYMTLNQSFVPTPLARSISLMHAVPEKIILLTIKVVTTPYAARKKRLTIEESKEEAGLYFLTASYGYMERPNLYDIAEASELSPASFSIETATFFIGRETLLPVKSNRVMAKWRWVLFAFLYKNAWNAAVYFNIPPARVLEIGVLISPE